MSDQPTHLSKLARWFLIVSILGLCMMGAMLWGPVFSPSGTIWDFPPNPTLILLVFGSGLVLYVIFSLPVKWEMLRCSLHIGIWGILTLLLMLGSAAVFFLFLPLTLTDFASMGWFGLIWIVNGELHFTVSTTWSIWWVWLFWAICYIIYFIELFLIVTKLV